MIEKRDEIRDEIREFAKLLKIDLSYTKADLDAAFKVYEDALVTKKHSSLTTK